MRNRLGILVFAAALLAASPAPAATLSFDSEFDPYLFQEVVVARYTAGAGEANAVTFRIEQAGTFHVKDPNATIRYVAGEVASVCVIGALAHEARCTTAPAQVHATLGDRNDAATALGRLPSVLDGDAGNDRLTVQNGRATMRGGAGADTLAADPQGTFDPEGEFARFAMEGGEGADVLEGRWYSDMSGGPGPDRMRGRDASTVSYEGATTGVHVTIDGVANDGAPGEGDNVQGVFSTVRGTAFADTLIGSAAGESLRADGGDDVLEGRGGADVLEGADGNDELVGGDDSDSLYGGPGDDTLFAIDGFRDFVHCGTGIADTAYVDALDNIFTGAPCDSVFLR